MKLLVAYVGLLVACSGPNPNYCALAHDFNCSELDAGGNCRPACTEKTPVCGLDSTCHACTAHSECTSNVCLLDGSCGDATNVAYVDPRGTSNASCSQAMPCRTITAGLATRRPVVKVTGTIEDVVMIGANVTILADPNAKLTSTNLAALVTITGTSTATIADLELSHAIGYGVVIPMGTSATLTLIRVRIDNNSMGGVALRSGSLTVQQSTLTENSGLGINATGGQLTVVRSSITHNASAGVLINAAKFDLENNFITNNHGPGVQVAAIPTGQQPALIEFNTLMANAVDSGAAGIDCSGTTSNMTFIDNLIYGNLTGGSPTTQISGASCKYSYSDIGPGAVISGSGNLAADPLVINLAQEEDHLTALSPCRDAADAASSVTLDYEGDMRPQGGRSDIGADEYHP